MMSPTMDSESLVYWKRLCESCAREYPDICIDRAGVYYEPHIVGTKLTVSSILERLYVHGSISSVVEYYPEVTERQIKEAIAYAATFMDVACRPMITTE